MRLRPRSVYDVMAAIGCFGALAGGTAWAANTIGSSDIIDESILSQDVKNGEIKNSDIATSSVGSGKIVNNQVKGLDVAEPSLDLRDFFFAASNTGSCTADQGVQACATKVVSLPRPAKLLVNATAQWLT